MCKQPHNQKVLWNLEEKTLNKVIVEVVNATSRSKKEKIEAICADRTSCERCFFFFAKLESFQPKATRNILFVINN